MAVHARVVLKDGRPAPLDRAELPAEARPGVPALRPAPLWHRVVAGTMKALVPLALLAGAAWGYVAIIESAPSPEKRARAPLPRLVEVVPAVAARQGPVIEAWGTVEAERLLTLRPEVSGRIVEVEDALRPGGRIAAGTALIGLDTADLALALAEAEARVAQIEARIAMERGQAQRAERDFNRLPLNVTPEQRALILREPQMAELSAERAAAIAQRDRAASDLAKARITAPFDAVVLSETVEPGSMLMAGSEAAELAATDRFELRLAVPLTALDWVEPGAPVRLDQPNVWPDGTARAGRIDRIAADLAAAGRMAGVIVTIDDPLALAPDTAANAMPPVLIGSYLRAEIEGRAVQGAVRLPRELLHDGDTVWIMTPEDRLEIRKVEIAWRGPEAVLVTAGLAAGERIVATDLAIYADGMALRLPETSANATEAAE
ncbi:MAG: efflux RND transporter periplasmic adaptor subunit [Pseudomonadota bacterium]